MPGLPDRLLRRAAPLRDTATLLAVLLLPWSARFIRSYGFLGDAPWEAATRGVFATELLLLAALVLHLLHVSSGQAPKTEPPTWMRFWLLFLLFALLTVAWAPRPEAAVTAWTHLFEGFALAYLIWVSRRPLAHYAYALVLGGTANALFAVWQFLTQTSFASTLLGISAHPASEAGVSVVETASGRYLRAYGLSPHPNILGGHLALALPVAAWLYVACSSRRLRPFLLAAAGLMALALAFSFSRSAWLAYAVVMLIGVAYRFRTRSAEESDRIRKLALLHVAAGLVFLAVAAPLIATRFGMETRLERVSIDERSVAAYRAIELLKTHYAAGVGIGNMPAAAYMELRPRGDAYSYQSAHHVVLLAAVETGFFGLMMLLGAAVIWIGEARRLFRRATGQLVRASALLPGIFIIIGFFDHYPISLYAGTLMVGAAFGLFLKAAAGNSGET